MKIKFVRSFHSTPSETKVVEWMLKTFLQILGTWSCWCRLFPPFPRMEMKGKRSIVPDAITTENQTRVNHVTVAISIDRIAKGRDIVIVWWWFIDRTGHAVYIITCQRNNKENGWVAWVAQGQHVTPRGFNPISLTIISFAYHFQVITICKWAYLQMNHLFDWVLCEVWKLLT